MCAIYTIEIIRITLLRCIDFRLPKCVLF